MGSHETSRSCNHSGGKCRLQQMSTGPSIQSRSTWGSLGRGREKTKLAPWSSRRAWSFFSTCRGLRSAPPRRIMCRCGCWYTHVRWYIHRGIFQNRGTLHLPPKSIILIVGTPKRVPPIFGNPHIYIYICICLFIS